ncbi:MAG: hypothetical protein SXU28_15095, partial [Pseudomonadota bacterium]|nr:hypothetical protein [Pseudomonadota bacterium]
MSGSFVWQVIVPALVIGGFILIRAAVNGKLPRLPSSSQPDEADLDSGHVLVSGWALDDLEKILSDFCGMYELPRESFTLVTDPDGWQRIFWPEPIHSHTAQFLVNYIHYPNGFDFDGASPCAVGVMPTTSGAGPVSVPVGAIA